MRNLYNILEGLLDYDFDVSPEDLLIGRIYTFDISSNAPDNTQTNRFWPISVISEQFRRVTKAVPKTDFPIKFKGICNKMKWLGSNNPIKYLLDWAVSQPITIIDNNELTEKELFKWIPKQKNIRAEWTAPKNLTFYYKARTDEYAIINLILCEK